MFVIFLIGDTGTCSSVHPVVQFDCGNEERPIVPLLRLKVLAVAAIIHVIMRGVGHGDPTWM